MPALDHRISTVGSYIHALSHCAGPVVGPATARRQAVWQARGLGFRERLRMAAGGAACPPHPKPWSPDHPSCNRPARTDTRKAQADASHCPLSAQTVSPGLIPGQVKWPLDIGELPYYYWCMNKRSHTSRAMRLPSRRWRGNARPEPVERACPEPVEGACPESLEGSLPRKGDARPVVSFPPRSIQEPPHPYLKDASSPPRDSGPSSYETRRNETKLDRFFAKTRRSPSIRLTGQAHRRRALGSEAICPSSVRVSIPARE